MHDGQRGQSQGAAGAVSTDTVLTASEVAAILGVSERTVRRYAERGELAGELIRTPKGTAYHFRRGAVDAYHARRDAVIGQVIEPSGPREIVAPATSHALVPLARELAAAMTAPLADELALARAQVERLATENGRLVAENALLRRQASGSLLTRVVAVLAGR